VLFLEARIGDRVVRYALPSGEFCVGRDSGCEVMLDHRSVSRRHLMVKIENERVDLEDRGSTNGLHVDGQKVGHASVGVDKWCGGNLSEAARGADLNRGYVYRKLAEHDLRAEGR